MMVFGFILLGIGSVLFFVQRSKNTRAFHIRSARQAEARGLQQMARDIAGEIGGGSWRDYVKIRGKVTVAEPLIAELSQQPCVHYSMKVKREYEEIVTSRDSRGRTSTNTRRGSEVVADNERSIPFFLEDDTGRIAVDPDGASIETIEVLDDFKPESNPGGSIAFGGFSMNLPAGAGGRRTIGYRYTESILPIDTSVLIVGAVSDSTGEVRLCQSADSRKKLIISVKAYEALAAAAERGARVTRNMMFGFVLVGAALLVVSLFR